MKKALLRKSIVATALLLVLAFSVTAINTPLVKANVGGIGKFITINIDGEGSVTATKVKSGETWTFSWSDPQPVAHKVGAGTVTLSAVASEGWGFSHWGGDLSGNSNPTPEYKTEKLGYVEAWFVKKTFTITAIVASEAPKGHIETNVDGNPTEIWDQLDVVVEYGASQTFTFCPYSDCHVSTIAIDSGFVVPVPTYSYTFDGVQNDWAIKVFFSADGEAYVPPGTNVPLNLGDGVGLIIASTEGGGTATQEDLLLDATGTTKLLWEVSVSTGVSSAVTITLPYEVAQGEPDHVYYADSANVLCSDVDRDGDVDSTDVRLIANAINDVSEEHPYNPDFDVNRDGALNSGDVNTANKYIGTVLDLVPLDKWTIEDGYLIIQMDHLSVFRAF